MATPLALVLTKSSRSAIRGGFFFALNHKLFTIFI